MLNQLKEIDGNLETIAELAFVALSFGGVRIEQ